jgi:hypothetical protein
MKMRTISQRMEGIERRATVAVAEPKRTLNDAELDCVTAAGSKPGASSGGGSATQSNERN